MSFNKVKAHALKEAKRNMTMTGTFVGTREVEAISVNEELDMVGVLFKDDSSETFTLTQWEAVKSDKQYPQGEVSMRRFKSAISKITNIVLTYEVDREAAVRGILDVLMDERCTLNSFAWVIQQVNNNLQSVLGEVDSRIKESWRNVVSKVFDVPSPEAIYIKQLHEELTEIKPESMEEETQPVETTEVPEGVPAETPAEAPTEEAPAAEQSAEQPAA